MLVLLVATLAAISRLAHREYNIGLRCELERKTAPDDTKRGCELAAYFTHTKLHPTHLVLVLRSAMNASFKLKCYATSATFCRRMLELPLQPKVPPLSGPYEPWT